jgi:transcriptional regulator of acetoin/glycerol metabolism
MDSLAIALATRSLASRSVSGRRKLSDIEVNACGPVSEIWPILASPMFVPQATTQAVRVAVAEIAARFGIARSTLYRTVLRPTA